MRMPIHTSTSTPSLLNDANRRRCPIDTSGFLFSQLVPSSFNAGPAWTRLFYFF